MVGNATLNTKGRHLFQILFTYLHIEMLAWVWILIVMSYLIKDTPRIAKQDNTIANIPAWKCMEYVRMTSLNLKEVANQVVRVGFLLCSEISSSESRFVVLRFRLKLSSYIKGMKVFIFKLFCILSCQRISLYLTLNYLWLRYYLQSI